MTDTAYTAPAAATPGPASPSPSFGPLTSPEPGAKTAWPIQYIPINDIEYGERLRPLDPAEVDRKAESIAQIGLLQAITVAKHPAKMVEGSNPPRPVYVLQAGLHRAEACKKLNWEMIPAHVTTLDGAYARLVEVDENLCRAELDAAMRAKFTNERKAIYEALYPDTAKGKAQGEGKKRAVSDSKIRSEIDTPAPKQKSFVEDTADKTGRSKSTIALEAERGGKIADDVLDALAGTPHAKGYVLDELKRLTHEQQREKVKELQAAQSKPKAPKGKPEVVRLTPEQEVEARARLAEKNQQNAAWDEAFNVFEDLEKFLAMTKDLDQKTVVANLRYDEEGEEDVDPHAARKEALGRAEACIQWLTDFAEALRQIIPTVERELAEREATIH